MNYSHLVRVKGLKKLFYPTRAQRERLVRAANVMAEKTGIVERDLLYDEKQRVNLPNTYLCCEAILNALKEANMKAEEVDGFIYATNTPDFIFPSNGLLVANLLGMNVKQYGTVEMACASFIKAIQDAMYWIESGYCENVLIAAGDINSRLRLPNNHREAFIFGDNFTVVILKKADKGGITTSNISADRRLTKLLVHRPSYSHDLVDHQTFGITNDKGVGTIGLVEKTYWPWLLKAFTNAARIEMDEGVKVILPQVTKSAYCEGLENYRKETGDDIEKNALPLSSLNHGNVGAGAAPLALAEALERGSIKPKDKIIILTVGVGGLVAALMIDPCSEKAVSVVDLSNCNGTRFDESKLYKRSESAKTRYEADIDVLLHPLNPKTQKRVKIDDWAKMANSIASTLGIL